MAPTFAEATAVVVIDSHTYQANFHNDWCVGSVPHGGVVTSVLLRVAATHFSKTLASQHQPHTITAHVEFLRRTQTGLASVQVRHVKLGRQTSTIHVTLIQHGVEEAVAYITNSNLEKESGLSFETGWSLAPSPPPVDLGRLASEGSDQCWIEKIDPANAKIRKVMNHVGLYVVRDEHAPGIPSLCDQWLRFTNGEKFTNESIGLVSDLFPQIVEMFMARNRKTAGSGKKATKGGRLAGWNWYPTLLLNLDIKKLLPGEGVEWLFLRVRAKSIKNGRMDYEVVVMDEKGDIVALSHHVVFILDGSRNTAVRNTDQSKI